MIENLATELNLTMRIPIVHRYVYQTIITRNTKFLKKIPIDNNKIERHTIKVFLSRYMVPEEIQDIFLQEMEAYGLIKQYRRIIKILPSKF